MVSGIHGVSPSRDMVQLRLAELLEFTVLHSQAKTQTLGCNGQMIDSTPSNLINDHGIHPCHEGDSVSLILLLFWSAMLWMRKQNAALSP